MRLGGVWTPSQRLKNNLLWALAAAGLGATRPLPLWFLRALGAWLGLAAYALLGPARSTALGNVARVFVDRTGLEHRRLVRRCFVTLGETLGETVALLRDRGRPDLIPLAPEARAMLRATRGGVLERGSACGGEQGAAPVTGVGGSERSSAGGSGVVFVSAHLGPWELVAASLVGAGVRLVALARRSYDPRFSSIYRGLRERAGIRVLWRDDPGLASGIVGALRSGAVLGVPMDLRSRVESRDIPFLGHRAPTPIGPARIALRTGCPVVVGSVAPAGGSRLVITASPIDTADLRANEDGVLELTKRINAELSRRILAIPHAWVWMHERWTRGTDL